MIWKWNPKTTDPAWPKNRRLLQPKRICHRSAISKRFTVFFSLGFAFLFPATLATVSQELPSEVRGYKVHHAVIAVHNSVSPSTGDKQLDARIRLGEPRLIDVSLTGITFEVPIETSPVSASGTIDFLTFSNFRVNGIPVEIEEYPGPITFKKGDPFSLPRAASVFVSSGGVLQAAWNEFKNSKKDWIVTGRVLAFGKFRKMGLKFKRVVPIDIDVLIKNPFANGKTTASTTSHP